MNTLLKTHRFLSLLMSLTFISGTAKANDGDWISIGVPTMIHQGTDGAFYLNGNDQTSCNGVMPSYFRVDMNAPHWKEFYALVLYSSANNRHLACTVQSGCGTPEVWVRYCRVSLR